MSTLEIARLQLAILKSCPLFLVSAIIFAGLAQPAKAQITNSQAYTFSTFAGFGGSGSADGVGSAAQFHLPLGIAVDGVGNLYVADGLNCTIRKITSSGIVTTVAGFPGNSGSSDGTGSTARFNRPEGIVTDAAGNIYVADEGNNTIRQIDQSGVVTTIAGFAGSVGTNDGLGSSARFNGPQGLALDMQGNIYVADAGNCTIRRVTRSGGNWFVKTIAGNAGLPGAADGTNNSALFYYPCGVALDTNGNIYVADGDGLPIRKIVPNIVAGVTNWVVTSFSGLDGQIPGISGVAIDGTGNLYVATMSVNQTTGIVDAEILKIVPNGTNWSAQNLAGSLAPDRSSYADGTGTNALFEFAEGAPVIAADSTGNIYIADSYNNAVRQISSAGVVTTAAGANATGGLVNGSGQSARFHYPNGVKLDKNTNLYVADFLNNSIRKVSPAGLVSTIAGSTNAGSLDAPGTSAQFNGPTGVAIDTQGNIYVADSGNFLIRQITPAFKVSTIAGLAGVMGTNNGLGNVARFYIPTDVAVDGGGTIYVVDNGNFAIRAIIPSGTNWQVSTIAGLPGSAGVSDGIGTAARFNFPTGIAVDSNTNIYVGDSHLRMLTRVGTNWMVKTINGTASQVYYVTADDGGNIFVTQRNSTIQRVSPSGTNWVITTIGGMPNITGSKDGAGSSALFNSAQGIAVDHAGILYVGDTLNNTIRRGVFTQYGAANPVTYSRPSQTGALHVTLLPPEANGQWRFPWEVTWHTNGYIATNLAPGNYPVEFRSLPGWQAVPPSLTISNAIVVSANQTAPYTNTYYPTLIPPDASGSGGSLTVSLGANPPSGAGWRFLGDTNAFFFSNFTTNLLPGTYLIEFAGPFPNRATPQNASVQVFAGLPTIYSVTYAFAAAPSNSVLLPTAVPANQINDVMDYPFGFNGQLQTDAGFGSGVVVQSNVVLTAAHLVFNDDTQSYVNGAYFFLQEEIPAYAPSPLIARGWYVLSGYAAQRTNDINTPPYGRDISSPQSRNLDVAALYFQDPVAGGGYAGYLPSDQVPNQWLTGTAEKMLTGYPVDGSPYGVASIVPGALYQVGPAPDALSLDPESVTNQQEVYDASWFLSYPGNSGGPLYVQLNGYYYPAGIYLGTLNGQSVVRGIDSNVVNLITFAATLGDNGTNHGGGVILLVPGNGGTISGQLLVAIQPPSAVAAGASWKYLTEPDANYLSQQISVRMVAPTNMISLQFKAIPGWVVPTNQTIAVSGGTLAASAFYTVSNPVLIASAQGLGLRGTTNTTYSIEKTTSLKNPVWVTNISAITITNTNFSLAAPKTSNPAATFYRAVWLGY